MEAVLRGLHWKTLLTYLDDVIVFAQDLEQHCERLSQVFERLRGANLKLKPSKCGLFKRRVHYLGHIVSAEGVATDPAKVETVKTWPVPNCQTQLRSFLSTVGYYQRYIPDFATVAGPLNALTSKNEDFIWSPPCQSAFDSLKVALVSAPILGYPDPKFPYILDTDASNWGAGTVLSQIQSGFESYCIL